MEYLDFELEVGAGDGRVYPVEVVDSPSGESQSVMQWPFDEIKLQLHLTELENALLRSAATRRVASSESEKTVEEFGATMFNVLFTDEVRSRYEISLERARMQGKGLRIKLRIQAPELAALPWEFLFDPNRHEYLCFSRQTPVVRYPALPIPVQPMKVELPLRILGMVASPRDLPSLDVETEKARLSQPLAKLQQAGLVELHWLEGQTWRDLQSAMRQGPWHVFHFIGHGGFDATRDEGFLAICDDNGGRFDLRTTKLAQLIADHASLRLVVLNACEGARSSQSDIFSSSASILLRRGVPAVLAMQYAITDRAAVEFARTFYEALADGLPVDTAVAEGRLAISLAFADTFEWGTPVLFLRAEDGMLFDVSKEKLMRLGAVGNAVSVAENQPDPAPLPAERGSGQVGASAAAQPPWSLAGLWRTIGWRWRAVFLVGAAALIAVAALVVGVLQRNPLGAGQTAATLPSQAIGGVAAATAKASPTSAYSLNSEPMPDSNQADSVVDGAGETETAVPLTETLAPTRIEATATPQATRTPGAPTLEPATATLQLLAAGAMQVSAVDGMVQVYIPAGEFQMGCDPARNAGFPCSRDELLHLLYLDAYWIDQIHVTNAMYARCVAAGGCLPPISASSQDRASYYGNPEFDDYPVIFVNWERAAAYCQWAGRRLPTEAEWEKAGRGDLDTRPYPWGDDLPTCETANFKPGSECVGETSKSSDYPAGASPYGVLDMVGNVWNWVNDYYTEDYYQVSPKINPAGPGPQLNRVIRGACWVNNAVQLRVSNRFYTASWLGDDDIGFRCAASP